MLDTKLKDMPKVKEGKIFRDRLEDIFATKDFLKPGFRTSKDKGGTYPRLINRRTKTYNYTSLDIYRLMMDGVDVAITTHNETKFFCPDIDRKKNTTSIYYNNLEPVINALHKVGLEGYLICHNPTGGIKIWIPLPFHVFPPTANKLLEEYFISQGLKTGRHDLDLLAKKVTITGKKEVEFKQGGKRAYLDDDAEHLGDLTRLPKAGYELVQKSLWETPRLFTVEEFYGELWENAEACNSEFTLENLSLQQTSEVNVGCDEGLTPALGDRVVVYKAIDIDTAKVSDQLLPNNQVSHGGERSNAGRKLGTIEDKAFEAFMASKDFPQLKGVDLALEVVNRGWTGPGQSSQILMQCAILCSYVYRTYNELDLAKEIKALSESLPGFQEHSSEETKKDLNKYMSKGNWAMRWAKSVIKYRDRLFNEGRLWRTHDYLLKQDDKGERWIQSLDKNGKPTNAFYNGGKNRGVGRGNNSSKKKHDSIIYINNIIEKTIDPKEVERLKLAKELGISIF